MQLSEFFACVRVGQKFGRKRDARQAAFEIEGIALAVAGMMQKPVDIADIQMSSASRKASIIKAAKPVKRAICVAMSHITSNRV